MIGVLRAGVGARGALQPPQPTIADLRRWSRSRARRAWTSLEARSTGDGAARTSAGPSTGSCRRRSPTPASTRPGRCVTIKLDGDRDGGVRVEVDEPPVGRRRRQTRPA